MASKHIPDTKNILKVIKFWNKIKEAQEVESVPSGCVFSWTNNYPEFVISPMKSGRKALVRIICDTPSDPGDQHFYSHKTLCYVKEVKGA